VDGKLVIVEIKRPSHDLSVDDLNQLETYVDIVEKNSNLAVRDAILLGRQISAELHRIKKYRGSQFKVWNYAEVFDDTENRYKKYLRSKDVAQ
jgi:RecB family endonuclease NucS